MSSAVAAVAVVAALAAVAAVTSAASPREQYRPSPFPAALNAAGLPQGARGHAAVPFLRGPLGHAARRLGVAGKQTPGLHLPPLDQGSPPLSRQHLSPTPALMSNFIYRLPRVATVYSTVL